MMQWWGLAKRDEPLGVPAENKDFVNKFVTTFIDKIAEIKKTKDSKPVVIVGKDVHARQFGRLN